MNRRRLLLAVLLLVGMGVATAEESLVHTDDGCVLETHCNACLLQLGTTGVATVVFALPRVVAPVGRVAPSSAPRLEDRAPHVHASRGPPPA